MTDGEIRIYFSLEINGKRHPEDFITLTDSYIDKKHPLWISALKLVSMQLTSMLERDGKTEF